MKSFWKLLICFCYFCEKNCFSFWMCSKLTPYLQKLGPKIILSIFFQNHWILIESIFSVLIESPNIFHYENWKKKKRQSGRCLREKHLGHIKSNVVKEKKETGIISTLFSYFAWEIQLKRKKSGHKDTWVKI